MNRTHYFLSLWALSSLSDLSMMILHGFTSSMWINYPVVQIMLYGLLLLFGFYAAQKSGFRFVLLEQNYNIVHDIIKPAVVCGIVVAASIFLIIPILSLQVVPVPFSPSMIYRLLHGIKITLAILLAGLGGLAFILRKIAKNASTSTIIPMVIGLIVTVSLCPLIFDCIYKNCVNVSLILDHAIMIIVTIGFSGILFWKKGLEVAVLYDIVLISLLHMIAPAVLFYFRA